jgi:hypothetical protein
MSDHPAPAELKSRSRRRHRPHAAQLPAPLEIVGGPEVAARQGALSALRPDPHATARVPEGGGIS